MENKIPKEIIKELDINDAKTKQKDFEVTPIVEAHQIKLPIPRKLLKIYDLDFKKGQKIKLEFNKGEKKLIYKW